MRIQRWAAHRGNLAQACRTKSQKRGVTGRDGARDALAFLAGERVEISTDAPTTPPRWACPADRRHRPTDSRQQSPS